MNWQPIIAILIVVAAAAWLTFRVVRVLRNGLRSGSGVSSGCGHCPRNPQGADPTPIVSLSGPREKSREVNQN